ncbi:metal ABC transporter solute-binding protein, Zn/Mn family [Alsobacter sp. R-9]
MPSDIRAACFATLDRRRLLGLGFSAFIATATGPRAMAQDKPLSIVGTTAMIADAVRNVGRERVAVTALFGEGVDPHVYKPTRADTARMLSADMVVANGLHLEAQFREAFELIGRTRPVVLAGEVIPVDRRIADADYKDRYNPHVWMDPDLWSLVVGAIRDALAARLPAGSGTFDAGAAAYRAELGTLSRYARQVLGTVPQDRRVLVTAHDAFTYFARAYGFEVVGIQGVSTESEAGLRRIEEVVDLVASRRIPTVFVEASVSDRNVRAVVEGAKRRGHELAIGAQLFSDSMGAPGTYEGTYIGMIDHNVTTIARALGGEAPQAGLSGKLARG